MYMYFVLTKYLPFSRAVPVKKLQPASWAWATSTSRLSTPKSNSWQRHMRRSTRCSWIPRASWESRMGQLEGRSVPICSCPMCIVH